MKRTPKIKLRRKRQSEVASLNISSEILGKRSCVTNRPANPVVQQNKHEEKQVLYWVAIVVVSDIGCKPGDLGSFAGSANQKLSNSTLTGTEVESITSS